MRPRFPQVDPAKGHYESLYLRAVDPARPRSVWLRYTVHKRPGDRPTAALWCVLFDAEAGGPRAVKESFPDAPRARPDGGLEIGGSAFGAQRIAGRAAAGGHQAAWELDLAGGEPALDHLPRPWMYSALLPRTKPSSPRPNVTVDGRLTVDGLRAELAGWRGVVGHNWGAEHAERWIWLHGIAFEGHPEAWLDLALGRVKVGRLTTPWVANGALSLDGERHRLGGFGKAGSTSVREEASHASFSVRGEDGLGVHGWVRSPRDQIVGWTYADPDPAAAVHEVANCSVAELRLTVERPHLELRTDHGATYELGMREGGHGIAIQPYPDP